MGGGGSVRKSRPERSAIARAVWLPANCKGAGQAQQAHRKASFADNKQAINPVFP